MSEARSYIRAFREHTSCQHAHTFVLKWREPATFSKACVNIFYAGNAHTYQHAKPLKFAHFLA